ncbi:MAG: hypothetical protein RLY57_705 [Candidatus Parcubacteria bacterium]|jgi:hypothetical protein
MTIFSKLPDKVQAAFNEIARLYACPPVAMLTLREFYLVALTMNIDILDKRLLKRERILFEHRSMYGHRHDSSYLEITLRSLLGLPLPTLVHGVGGYQGDCFRMHMDRLYNGIPDFLMHLGDDEYDEDLDNTEQEVA